MKYIDKYIEMYVVAFVDPLYERLIEDYQPIIYKYFSRHSDAVDCILNSIEIDEVEYKYWISEG